MKTTLIIDDQLMVQIKRLAAGTKKSMSQTVEALLRSGLRSQKSKKDLPTPLPKFRTDGALVDISDRNALYRAMDD